MANKKKTEEANAEVTNPENVNQNEQVTQSPETQNPENEEKVNEGQEVQTETVSKQTSGKDPSPRVLEIMRLYPHYEELWITPNGFVHSKNAPAYCIKGATLYKNKYFKK